MYKAIKSKLSHKQIYETVLLATECALAPLRTSDQEKFTFLNFTSYMFISADKF